jgi:uncharacterized protein (DUF58 family)
MKINKQDILNTGNLDLLANKAVEGFITGLHKSPFHGFSVEFAEHRQYNVGESTRNIDWKLYGRTDKLYSKRFDEETNLRCQIIIDVSTSMQIEEKDSLSKLQYAIWSSAVFLQLLKKQRDACGVVYFDDTVIASSKIASSSRHYKELTHQLETYLTYNSSQKTTDISETLHTIAAQIHKRSLVILFTDFLEENRDIEKLFDAIKHLKHHKHEVIVFHTLHKSSEISFEFGHSPVHFIDAESGESLKLQPNDIKSFYVERMKTYTSNLKSRFAQYKIDYVEADTSLPVELTFIPFLVKRRRMSR